MTTQRLKEDSVISDTHKTRTGNQQTARPKKIRLHQLILLLAISSVAVVLANSLIVSHRVQQDLLISAVTESNRAYAAKLATSIDEFLATAQQQLAYSSGMIGNNMSDLSILEQETKRLHQQTDSFNSVVIVDSADVVLANSPDLGLIGQRLTSDGARYAQDSRQPWISSPFVSTAGNLIIFISQPIFDEKGNHKGYIGGTIYLLSDNILNVVLRNHYHEDGSFVSIIDQSRRILHHRSTDLIGTQAPPKQLYELATDGQSGGMRLSNSENVDVLAGYAPVPSTGWGVIVQKPTDLALAPLQEATEQVLIRSLPIAVLIILGILWLSRKITSPLRLLAESAQKLDQLNIGEQIGAVKPWYHEAAELKRAMLLGTSTVQGKIQKLNNDVQLDALTGLYNRRKQEEVLMEWRATSRPFALLEIDIDYFKRVNDNFGHETGDNVLKQLAALMKQHTRNDDLACRIGGEEFTLLLPDTSTRPAQEVAERLRKTVQATPFPEVGEITVSIGVAHWPDHVANIDDVMRVADQMLYKAKRSGRNQVQVAQPGEFPDKNG